MTSNSVTAGSWREVSVVCVIATVRTERIDRSDLLINPQRAAYVDGRYFHATSSELAVIVRDNLENIRFRKAAVRGG